MPAETALIEPDLVRRFFKEVQTKEWGIRVDQQMRALGITESKLARLTGSTPQTISKVRRGEIVPREYLRVAIAVALAAEPAQLFPTPSKERVLAAVNGAAA